MKIAVAEASLLNHLSRHNLECLKLVWGRMCRELGLRVLRFRLLVLGLRV